MPSCWLPSFEYPSLFSEMLDNVSPVTVSLYELGAYISNVPDLLPGFDESSDDVKSIGLDKNGRKSMMFFSELFRFTVRVLTRGRTFKSILTENGCARVKPQSIVT